MVKVKISELHATNSEWLTNSESSVDSAKDLSAEELKATKGGNFAFGGFPGGFGFPFGGGFGFGGFPGFGFFGRGKFRF
jgi:hypothetical protein